MPRRSKLSPEQLGLLDARVKTAPCVPAIRKEVAEWRENNYKGITDTTRLLLNYWFKTDHRLPDGKPFWYHDSQREAMETLTYIFEISKCRIHKDLLEKYAPDMPNLKLLQYDDFTRYCFKMATGSSFPLPLSSIEPMINSFILNRDFPYQLGMRQF